MTGQTVQTLLCDVGGVLLTNGWGRDSRKLAAETFGFDLAEFESRHHLAFDAYEMGKTPLEYYLQQTIFYKERPFSVGSFIEFMYAQSQPHEDMLSWMRQLKGAHPKLKIALLSNEGRELTQYRFKKFNVADFADFFIVSSFVHLRKPDPSIYKLALDLVQTPPERVAYIDDRPLFAEMGAAAGMRSICHRDCATTKAAIESML